MKSIEELHKLFVLYNFHLKEADSLINWAVHQLERDEEGNDNDIVLLAGTCDEIEARELTKKIIERYKLKTKLHEEYLCGKYIVELYDRYKNGKIEISELDKIITKLYNGLGFPDWLAMLSRNCEYAIDIQPFEKPFQDEFEYIAGLWGDCSNLNEFNNKYDRKISNKHDIEYC